MHVQTCPSLCDLMDCSLPGSSVHGIFQARLLEWVAISFSRGSSQGSNPHLLHHSTLTGCVLNSFSRLTLCNPMDSNLPRSPVHRILQARTMEWVAILSSLAGRLFTTDERLCIFFLVCWEHSLLEPSCKKPDCTHWGAPIGEVYIQLRSPREMHRCTVPDEPGLPVSPGARHVREGLPDHFSSQPPESVSVFMTFR